MQNPQLTVRTGRLRAIGGVRLSHLTDETTSPERQVAAIKHEVSSFGSVDIVGWAEDLDISAADFSPFERPALGPWLNERADEWDLLVFAKQDRAVRSMTDMSKLLEFCKKHEKVLVVCENPGKAIYDYRDGVEVDGFTRLFGQLGAFFFAFAAELEVYNVKTRVASMRKLLRENGEWGGGRFPFGYEPVRIEGQTRGWELVQHDETADIVKDIAQRIIDGDPQIKIAEDLNDQGVPTPFDYWDRIRNPEKSARRKPRRWTTTAIGKMMRSRALLGESEYENKVFLSDKGLPVMRSKDPLITSEQWELLQSALAERSVTKTRYSKESETLGVTFCGSCGGPMYAKESVSKGRIYSHLVCRYRQKQYGESCDQPAAPKEAVEGILRDSFIALLGDTPVMRRRYVPGDDRSEELASVRSLQKSLKRERDLGLIDDEDEYFERLLTLKERQTQLESVPVRRAGYVWEQTGETYGGIWDGLSPADRRKLLTDLGIRLYVGLPDKFETGDRSWLQFMDSEWKELPGNQWFSGAKIPPGYFNRPRASGDQLFSKNEPTAAETTRSYKKKPFQAVLVRSGSDELRVAISKFARKTDTRSG